MVPFGYSFFFQAEDGIRDKLVTGVQTCALPISDDRARRDHPRPGRAQGITHARHGQDRLDAHERVAGGDQDRISRRDRSEEHTSELQSLAYLVCRLLLEKKKKL